MSISFCTTAMARPKVLDRTLNSFTSRLKGLDFNEITYYINIEPLPDPSMREAVIEVAQKYFPTVVANLPEEANFTKAVYWCWNSVETDFLFHLEDDWELTCDVDMGKMLDRFSDKDVQQVVFRAYKYAYDKMCLSPSIIRTDFAQRFNFNFNKNPEVQLRTDFVESKNVCVPHKKIVVEDIGRKWIKKTDFKKPDHKSSFTSWEKK